MAVRMMTSKDRAALPNVETVTGCAAPSARTMPMKYSLSWHCVARISAWQALSAARQNAEARTARQRLSGLHDWLIDCRLNDYITAIGDVNHHYDIVTITVTYLPYVMAAGRVRRAGGGRGGPAATDGSWTIRRSRRPPAPPCTCTNVPSAAATPGVAVTPCRDPWGALWATAP